MPFFILNIFLLLSIKTFDSNGFFTPNLNIFCLGLLEWLWKAFMILMIFRSIQYLRDYCLHKELSSIKKFNNEYQSSDQLIIYIMSNNNIGNKQYNI
jgi:hypothetical protein